MIVGGTLSPTALNGVCVSMLNDSVWAGQWLIVTV